MRNTRFSKTCHQIKRQLELNRVVIFLLRTLVLEVLTEIYGNLLAGYYHLYKTKEPAPQCYYWHSMDADIAAHLKFCHH